MTVTEQEKMAAKTVMLITYGDGNTMKMFGIVKRAQRKPKMTASERMTIEISGFYEYVANQQAKGNVLLAQIYANNYLQAGKFTEAPERLMLEYRNGVWDNKNATNLTQVTGQKAGSEFE